jgi:hypothetical protein
MWMMEMIYTHNGMAWGIKRAFSLQRFMGWKNCERIDRWAKNRRPSATWENWNEKRLGLGSKSETTLPIGTYVGSRNGSNAFFSIYMAKRQVSGNLDQPGTLLGLAGS